MPMYVDITNKRFGRLTATKLLDKNFGRSIWIFSCLCGNEIIRQKKGVVSGKIQSCGCLKTELLQKNKRTLRHCFKGEYNVWKGIKARCFNPSNDHYKMYGGRGIKMCSEWKNSFDQFIKDMGERPSLEHSIDRIDNNGDYKKENCRWATREQQTRNTSRNLNVVVGGEIKCLWDYAQEINKPYNTVRDWYHKRSLPHGVYIHSR